MTTTLGTLLSSSWKSFKIAFVTIAIGAVIFGLILGVSQAFIGQRVANEASSTFMNLGLDLEKMESLQEDITLGDEAAMAELEGMMQQFGSGVQEEQVTGAIAGMFYTMLPVISLSMVLMLLITLVANVYFLLVALNEKTTTQQALANTPKLIIPLFLLWLWIFIRSFVWIPVIGIITGIILLPRFIVSPVLLVRDKKGVLESASISYAKTKGYWGKIIGNVIVAAILAIIVQIVIGIVLSMLGSMVAAYLVPVVNMLVTGFIIIFSVKLALTVEQNPKAG